MYPSFVEDEAVLECPCRRELPCFDRLRELACLFIGSDFSLEMIEYWEGNL